jgi:pimeloyl-ACP methyl ester carboxylesterase
MLPDRAQDGIISIAPGGLECAAPLLGEIINQTTGRTEKRMPRPVYRRRWAWATGMRTHPEEVIPDAESAGFSLSNLADQGLLTTRRLADFQDKTGLADLAWRMVWNRAALAEADGDFRSLLRRTHGFVIFMHGWSASGGVWEHLPALTCAANPRLAALVPDLNGFGDSPFLAEVPAREHCDPHAVMQVVAHWVDMLGLRSSARAQKRRKVITFVGHSLGAAALFYLRERDWRQNEFTRCAVAPTLLISLNLRQAFYRALGVDPRASKPIDDLKSQLTSRVVGSLTSAASEAVRAEHLRIFETTPKGTLAQTFFAMGSVLEELAAKRWHNFRVVLARNDQFVNVSQMLQLLDDLGLASDQIRVVRGDHFLFSLSDENRQVHMRNRETVLAEILHLHEVCRERQRS